MMLNLPEVEVAQVQAILCKKKRHSHSSASQNKQKTQEKLLDPFNSPRKAKVQA